MGAATPVFYASSPGGPLAQRTGTDASTLRYFVKDLHGDVVGLAATTGTNPMKGSILYSPWGIPGTKTGELATFPTQGHLGFQGQLTDALTGQVDMLTRYYDPTLGRFDTRDVLFGDLSNPTSLNQYVYGVDNPISNNDLTGMCPNPAVCPPPPTFNRQQRDEWFETGRKMARAQSVESPALDEPEPPPVLSLSQFARLSERRRILWLDQFTKFYSLKDWFQGIRGVLMAGRSTTFLDPGTWSSWVDAGILHGIQQGMRQYGGEIAHSRNPAAMKWASFFDAFYGRQRSAVELKSLWAAAETESTSFGRSLAEQRGLQGNSGELAVYKWASVWRNTVRWGDTLGMPEYNLAQLWDWASPDFELFDPRVPWPITWNWTMRIYLTYL